MLPFGFSLSAEAYRIFAILCLAKAALQVSQSPRPQGRGNLNSLLPNFRHSFRSEWRIKSTQNQKLNFDQHGSLSL
jgi:hypothetical protein